MLVGKPLVAVLAPAGAVVALHHLDRFFAGEPVPIGPFPHLVGPASFHRLGQPVLGQAQVARDAVLRSHPALFPVLVLVAVEVDAAVLFVCPAAVGVVAAHVAGPGVEAEPAPVAQAGWFESGGRCRSVGLFQGEHV